MFSVYVYRRLTSGLRSLVSKTPQKVEPEESFQPFEPLRDSSEELAGAASGCGTTNNISIESSTSKVIGSQNPNVPCPAPSPARPSALLSSVSSSPGAGSSRRADETSGTPHKGVGETAVGTLMSLRGSAQVLGGCRRGIGVSGLGGKSSPASRLSFVDRKWLERCQVFGEMGAEVKPGAGNQEVEQENGGEGEGGRETEGKIQTDDKVEGQEKDAEVIRRAVKDLESDKAFKGITSEETVCAATSSHQSTGKKRGEGGGEEKAKRKGGEYMEKELTPPLTAEDDNKTSNRSKDTKKKGRKRQREGEKEEADTAEEGGVKKRRRNVKKTEESSNINPRPVHAGGKKRRAKKKGDEDEEEEEKKETKEPKKVG